MSHHPLPPSHQISAPSGLWCKAAKVHLSCLWLASGAAVTGDDHQGAPSADDAVLATCELQKGSEHARLAFSCSPA